jgi:hypothetical protein
MMTQGFFYFLLIGELAILGLLIAGLTAKVKSILKLYSMRLDD